MVLDCDGAAEKERERKRVAWVEFIGVSAWSTPCVARVWFLTPDYGKEVPQYGGSADGEDRVGEGDYIIILGTVAVQSG